MLIALTTALALALAGPSLSPVSSESAATHSAPASASAEDAAREATAREWLALGDAGDWRASWEATSSQFQGAVAASDYEATMAPVRTNLGAVTDRQIATVNIIQENGKTYHILRFNTDFANETGKVERIALEREDGVYKVGGYFFER